MRKEALQCALKALFEGYRVGHCDRNKDNAWKEAAEALIDELNETATAEGIDIGNGYKFED